MTPAPPFGYNLFRPITPALRLSRQLVGGGPLAPMVAIFSNLGEAQSHPFGVTTYFQRLTAAADSYRHGGTDPMRNGITW
jgi:hypothetical protein